jgi:hypothetical protein
LEKAQRAMAAFSLRLRIGPQARTRAKVKSGPPLSYYEQQRLKRLEDDDDAPH